MHETVARMKFETSRSNFIKLITTNNYSRTWHSNQSTRTRRQFSILVLLNLIVDSHIIIQQRNNFVHRFLQNCDSDKITFRWKWLNLPIKGLEFLSTLIRYIWTRWFDNNIHSIIISDNLLRAKIHETRLKSFSCLSVTWKSRLVFLGNHLT